jgi:PAS domain S-box-containing protein
VRHILGYDPEEYRGESLLPFLHEDDAPCVAAWLLALATTPGTPQRLAFRFRHAQGHWVQLEGVGTAGANYEPGAGLVLNLRDVSERVAAERALQESEERYRALVEQLPGIVYTTAALTDGYPTTFVSPQVETLLGLRPDEWYADPSLWLAWVHEDDRERVRALWETAHATLQPFDAEYRMRSRDGRVLWFRDHAGHRRDAAGQALDIQGVMVDVTERKEAELALQRSEEHFRRLIENGNDVLMISGVDGALSYVSPSVRRVWGYDPEWMLGQRPGDLVHPDDLAAVMASLAGVAAKPGTVHLLTFRARHADGEWRTIEALNSTLDPTSADAGIMCNLRDISAQKAAETALRQAIADAEQARAEAERANRAKSEFLSRMSHELRTPLNSILGFAQVLQDVEMPPEYRTGVRHILNAGRHLLDLINEVLDIARIEADQQPMSIESVRVDAAIAQAADMVGPLATAHGIAIDVSVAGDAGDAGYVRADRQRLAQVLLNLLSNAIKYNRPRGTVRVACATLDDDGVGARLRIRVADEGSGIAPERRDQLFVPFARLGAEQTGIEGTGLGLALSQRLAQAMGGALVLERSGPEGSVFAVDLVPSVEPRVGAVAGLAPYEAGDAAPQAALILYVEDNLANLNLVETIVRTRPSWRIVPAMQGRTGLELAREHAPDVILLDLHLPDVPGDAVLRELRADPRTSRTPVVVITADATPRTADALRAQGADAFLTKPLDVSAFLRTVEQAIARRR